MKDCPSFLSACTCALVCIVEENNGNQGLSEKPRASRAKPRATSRQQVIPDASDAAAVVAMATRTPLRDGRRRGEQHRARRRRREPEALRRAADVRPDAVRAQRALRRETDAEENRAGASKYLL